MTITMSEKHQITIPKKIASALGLKKGAIFNVEINDNKIELVPLEVVENLQELEDDGNPHESIDEIWPDYPTKDDFMFNEDEY